MKRFKIFYTIFIISVLTYLSSLVLVNKSIKNINPLSSENTFYIKLEHSLSTSDLHPNNFVYKNFENEVEFYIQSNNKNTKVIFSTQKNPYYQTAALQQILKTAKIKDINNPKLVDLSSTHPYATF